jgi:hypothetical protein
MGIGLGFFIKHVRPHGKDSVATILQGGLKPWLKENKVPEEQITTLLLTWGTRADAEISDKTIEIFVDSAKLVSLARWEELYKTTYSTVLFLDGKTMKELSEQSDKNKGKNFTFTPTSRIPIAVTFNKSGAYQVDKDVKSVNVASDNDGNCCHLDSLVS